jgi:hypothetical protein
VNKNYKGFFVVFNGLDVALVVIVRRYWVWTSGRHSYKGLRIRTRLGGPYEESIGCSSVEFGTRLDEVISCQEDAATVEWWSR